MANNGATIWKAPPSTFRCLAGIIEFCPDCILLVVMSLFFRRNPTCWNFLVWERSTDASTSSAQS